MLEFLRGIKHITHIKKALHITTGSKINKDRPTFLLVTLSTEAFLVQNIKHTLKLHFALKTSTSGLACHYNSQAVCAKELVYYLKNKESVQINHTDMQHKCLSQTSILCHVSY